MTFIIKYFKNIDDIFVNAKKYSYLCKEDNENNCLFVLHIKKPVST